MNKHSPHKRPSLQRCQEDSPPTVSLWESFGYWLKLGFISFGSPAVGQISMMHQELVERRRWISENRFLQALNYCILLPGPDGQQLATYIGWLMHGVKGGILAGMLFMLPSLLVMMTLTWIVVWYGKVFLVTAGILYGIKSAVTAIIVFAAYRMGSRALKNNLLWALAALAFIAIFVFRVPFLFIVLGAAILGFIGGRVAPEKFRMGGGHGEGGHKSYGKALIDDDTPTPEYLRFKWSRTLTFLAVGLAIWGCTVGLLRAQFGWGISWGGMQMDWIDWFFASAELTFGGMYRAIPLHVYSDYHKYDSLIAYQMVSGLALGETTYGPLVMIVAFIRAGILGASIATVYTFLPSFLFIFLGGPLVETVHGDIKFTALLTGITAAVVGVVLTLATFFAYDLLWPMGFQGRFEWFSAILGIAAFIALFRFKVGIIQVIAACAVVGLLGYVVGLFG